MKAYVAPEVAAALQRSTDGCEDAWALLGRLVKDGVNVLHAIPAGPHATRGPRAVRFDADYQIQEAQRLTRDQPDLVLVGTAHTHPVGLDFPSFQDLQAHKAWLRQLPYNAGVFAILAAAPRWFFLDELADDYEPITLSESPLQ